LDRLGHHLVLAALDTVLSLPGSVLKPPLDEGETALGKIFPNQLSLAAEGHHVHKAGLLPFLLPLAEATVHGQAEGGHGSPLGGITKLWVPRQVSH
jgi:hypothetical protein